VAGWWADGADLLPGEVDSLLAEGDWSPARMYASVAGADWLAAPGCSEVQTFQRWTSGQSGGPACAALPY
jgi:hypothetical protein